MPEPLRVDAQRLTPAEEAAVRAAPMRTIRVKEPAPPLTPEAVTRARWRGMLIGASVATGAAVAAAVGWLFVARRRRGRSNA